MPFNVMSPNELFERVNACSMASDGYRPPFTLILGSGFSYGIIPTTAQIVREDLPWWKWCQRNEASGPTPDDYRGRKEATFAAKAKDEAKDFWKRVVDGHQGGAQFALGDDCLPTVETVGEAYRFALSAGCGPGLNSPHQVRRYFGDIIRRIGRRLNPAHLFLASLIAERPRLFGTIFTTNFDPLLQRSLQLVNAPYYVSDRPDTMQHADDDDVPEAVHIVHAHGSIYRYLLLNSPADIEEYAVRNRDKLQEYFRNHAVLIVGFSGWDDAITRALSSVDQFAHNLYWADRGTDPATSNLTPKAKEILGRHPNAFYVPIAGADELMAQLHQRLIGHSLPRLFRDPILVAKDQLELCDLTGVKLPRSENPSSPSPATDAGGATSRAAAVTGTTDDRDLGEEVKAVIKRLNDAQNLFTGQAPTDRASMLAAQVRQQFSLASDRYLGTNKTEALPYLDFVVSHREHLEPAEQALALFRRGYVYGERGQAGDRELAITDYTAVIDMPDAPAEQRAWARVNRGVAYRRRAQAGDMDRAIADYTAMIDMPDAPAKQRAQARVNRGFAYSQRGQAGDRELEIADYTAVIDMPDAPAKQRAWARNNRGVTYGQRGQAGDRELQIADYTAVIDMPDAPAEPRAQARVNRGVTYGERGQAGDMELAIADYTAVIDMPDAPAEQRARAKQLLD